MKLELHRLAKMSMFMRNLRLDVTPDVIFKPRFASQGNIEEQIAETQGFCFYVEVVDKEPDLMLMKNYNLSSKTIGDVPGVPKELLELTIKEPVALPRAGMYQMHPKLEAWVREQLGIQAD